MSKGDSDAPLRTYGRAKGRPLSPRQAGLVEALLPHLAIPAEGEIEPCVPSPLVGKGVAAEPRRVGGRSEESASASLAPPSVPHFARDTSPARGEGAQTILEIGFGAGEHLVAQAKAHPEQFFLGVEPFLNGVAKCLARIEDTGVANIRLHHGDARDVLARLPDASLDLAYILFPDPWPKKRHWKRRLIQPDFVAELARVLKLGGEIRFATDWKHYAAHTLETFLKEPRFSWLAERPDDWKKPWPGHVSTRYEQKKLGDSAPIFLRFSTA